MQKIVSGGQTGVDRAALDVALELSFPCGGWCPSGRIAEDGPIDGRYPLQETTTVDYPQRTEWNIRDSDGTLILAIGKLTGGTALTRSLARRQGKPCLVAKLDDPTAIQATLEWLDAENIETLNVAGPRESQNQGIQQLTAGFMRQLLQALPAGKSTHHP